MRRCYKCGESFQRVGTLKFGRTCRKCRTQASIVWGQKNPERKRTNWLRSRYGMTPEQYMAMLHKQGGGCAICGGGPTYEHGFLCVDHDHSCCPGQKSCGKCVRGLLCSACNHMLGHAKDQSTILIRAAQYINSYTER